MNKRILFPIKSVVDSDTNKKVIEWEGLGPMEIATRIAALALPQAATPTLGDVDNLPPLSIDTKFLASDNPNLPEEITKEMENLPVEIYDHTEESYRKSNENQLKSNNLCRSVIGMKRETLVSKCDDLNSTSNEQSVDES